MVSTRPSPNPARGRVAYPSAVDTYTSGDADAAPTLQRLSSREVDNEGTPGLKTWWKGKKRPEDEGYPPVFGAALSDSLETASVQISTAGSDGSLYVWGVIPVVVAKCGLFLKEHAIEVEGAFRISGSAKRMRELQQIFDTGPKYGKNIDWKNLPFTSHDVATIFRRFLTQMPEPIIPFDHYDAFRDTYDLDDHNLTQRYRSLILSLKPVNQYLLLYVLDLLHVFAKNSDKNLMTTSNLALIFQPGMLSHPKHAMLPKDHVLSQHVLEFLIDRQEHFVQAAPQKTKKKKKKRTRTKKPEPVMVKAEADLMLPSDSDEDAPIGGYYVIDAPPRIPKAMPKPVTERHVQHVRPNNNEFMDPSDSDDDIPPGGYEIRSSETARARESQSSHRRNRSGSDVLPPKLLGGISRRKSLPSKK